MGTFATAITIFSLPMGEIFFAIQICFKAFSKLQKVLTLKNFHKNPVFQYFKDMKLSNDLYLVLFRYGLTGFGSAQPSGLRSNQLLDLNHGLTQICTDGCVYLKIFDFYSHVFLLFKS